MDSSAFVLGFYLSQSVVWFLNFNEWPQSWSSDKAVAYGITAMLSLVSFRYHNMYKPRVVGRVMEQLLLILKHMFTTFIILLILLFVSKPDELLVHNRSEVILFCIISYVLISMHRILIMRFIDRQLKQYSKSTRRILAVGAGEVGNRFAMALSASSRHSYSLIGFLDDNPDLLGSNIDGVRVIGSTGDLRGIVKEEKVEEVFVTSNTIEQEQLMAIVRKCRALQCRVNIVSNQFNIIKNKLGMYDAVDLNFVTVYRPTSDIYIDHLKRMFDLLGALIIVLLTCPIFLALAIAIKLNSKGPVFFKTRTIGHRGKPFVIYKFRSMYHNVSNVTHKKLVEEFMNGTVIGAKLRDDPRVTSIGKFIRKHSIDEFAQLINVIKGEMSLVGPRPSTLYEYEQMEDWHKQRFDAMPGMTGLWQVAGRAEVSYTDMIMLDLYYVENRSFWFDIMMLIKTISVVVKGKGGF
jgi:undecaprenyl-phosphate galactose phosphotransferase